MWIKGCSGWSCQVGGLEEDSRSMEVVKEDMKQVGVREEDADGGYMEAGDLLGLGLLFLLLLLLFLFLLPFLPLAPPLPLLLPLLSLNSSGDI